MSTTINFIYCLLWVLLSFSFGAGQVDNYEFIRPPVLPGTPILAEPPIRPPVFPPPILPVDPPIYRPPQQGCRAIRCPAECGSYLVWNGYECKRVTGSCQQSILSCNSLNGGRGPFWSVEECPNCYGACTMEYNPLCVSSIDDPRKTISNPCMVSNYNCRKATEAKILYYGECKEDQNSECRDKVPQVQ